MKRLWRSHKDWLLFDSKWSTYQQGFQILYSENKGGGERTTRRSSDLSCSTTLASTTLSYQFNYLIRPFEDNINHKEPQGLKYYIQKTKGVEKEADELDTWIWISKVNIDHLLILTNKYGWVRLVFMVNHWRQKIFLN